MELTAKCDRTKEQSTNDRRTKEERKKEKLTQKLEHHGRTYAPFTHTQSSVLALIKNVATSTSCSLFRMLDLIQLSFLLFGSFSCLQWQKWIRACNFDPLKNGMAAIGTSTPTTMTSAHTYLLHRSVNPFAMGLIADFYLPTAKSFLIKHVDLIRSRIETECLDRLSITSLWISSIGPLA